MATVQDERALSVDELLQAASRLPAEQLEQFITLLQASRPPMLAPSESELLQKINVGLPRSVRVRYKQLIAKRRAETLTPQEYAELLRLGGQVEEYDAQRITWLADLAQLRGVSLEELMDTLDLWPTMP
jgi:hypothetical protein